MSTKSTRKKVIKKTETDLEFEKAKRNVKMIGIIATIFLFILVIIGFLTMGKPSYATLLESLPNSFTSKLGKNPKCIDNHEYYSLYFISTALRTRSCKNPGSGTPAPAGRRQRPPPPWTAASGRPAPE